jgi:hypothetical protein
MKLATKFAAVLGTAALLSSSALFAGEGKTFKKEIVPEEPVQWWNASLSTGWDSLYMFRGVNVIPGFEGYGSSLYWTQLSVTFNLSENDFLTLGAWTAFGISETSYKEFDGILSYTHTFGDLSVKLGYTYYQLLNVTYGSYSHELNAGLAYAFHLGDSVTITPGVNYYFNVGPDIGNRGFVEQSASYLEARVDGSVALYKDVVSLAPYVAFGTSFRYNFSTENDPVSPFVGTNNIQTGVSLPIAVTSNITVAPYAAYSYQWYGLVGTTPSTFWGGGSVTFSF